MKNMIDKSRNLSVADLNADEREFLARTRNIVQSNANPSRAVRRLVKIGFRIETVSKNGHYRLSHEFMGAIKVTFGSSPSDIRYALNFVREVRYAVYLRHAS